MAHKIIENNKEIYIIFEGLIEDKDFWDHHIMECLDSGKNVTIELVNVTGNTCPDCLNGLYIIAKDLDNVVLKGFSEDYKKSIDYRLSL